MADITNILTKLNSMNTALHETAGIQPIVKKMSRVSEDILGTVETVGKALEKIRQLSQTPGGKSSSQTAAALVSISTGPIRQQMLEIITLFQSGLNMAVESVSSGPSKLAAAILGPEDTQKLLDFRDKYNAGKEAMEASMEALSARIETSMIPASIRMNNLFTHFFVGLSDAVGSSPLLQFLIGAGGAAARIGQAVIKTSETIGQLKSSVEFAQRAFMAFDKIKSFGKDMLPGIVRLKDGFITFSQSFPHIGETFASLRNKLGFGMGALADFARKADFSFKNMGFSVGSSLKGMISVMTTGFAGGLHSLLAGIKSIQIALKAVFISNPLGLFVTVLSVIIGIVSYLYNKFEGVRKLIDTIINTFAAGIQWIVGLVKKIPFVSKIFSLFNSNEKLSKVQEEEKQRQKISMSETSHSSFSGGNRGSSVERPALKTFNYYYNIGGVTINASGSLSEPIGVRMGQDAGDSIIQALKEWQHNEERVAYA